MSSIKKARIQGDIPLRGEKREAEITLGDCPRKIRRPTHLGPILSKRFPGGAHTSSDFFPGGIRSSDEFFRGGVCSGSSSSNEFLPRGARLGDSR